MDSMEYLLIDMENIRDLSINRDSLRKHWYAKWYTENWICKIEDWHTALEALSKLKKAIITS